MGKKFSNSYLAYFLMYNFYFLSNSLFSTLISVYMLDKGYTAGQVSIVVSASFFSSMLVQPIMGLLNDLSLIHIWLMSAYDLSCSFCCCHYDGITAVSYTHLDVYKRQSYHWIPVRRSR